MQHVFRIAPAIHIGRKLRPERDRLVCRVVRDRHGPGGVFPPVGRVEQLRHLHLAPGIRHVFQTLHRDRQRRGFQTVENAVENAAETQFSFEILADLRGDFQFQFCFAEGRKRDLLRKAHGFSAGEGHNSGLGPIRQVPDLQLEFRAVLLHIDAILAAEEHKVIRKFGAEDNLFVDRRTLRRAPRFPRDEGNADFQAGYAVENGREAGCSHVRAVRFKRGTDQIDAFQFPLLARQ
ncbi:hypothetical protein SDC9_158728 [bioreactor metagenome]|uniref:Uncharacterized protein n=1 Tax=bioreactor metagenome TaxID=1076179 RepID=A0A645FAZ4_9ZZZZ